MYDEIVEEFEYEDMTIRIEYETDIESPRKEYDNMAHLVFLDNRYATGDGIVTVDEINEIMKDPDAIWLPVYMYAHSGATVSTSPFSCPWDSGFAGIVYAYTNEALKWGGFTEEGEELDAIIRRNLQIEVETFDQYLTGDVYYFETVKENEDGDEEILDSCEGLYGFDYAKQYALENAQCIYERSFHQLSLPEV